MGGFKGFGFYRREFIIKETIGRLVKDGWIRKKTKYLKTNRRGLKKPRKKIKNLIATTLK